MASESVPSFDRAGIIWTNWTVTVTKMVNELILVKSLLSCQIIQHYFGKSYTYLRIHKKKVTTTKSK